MDFSTKALAEISKLVAKEIGKQIDAGEIKKLDDLENGVREMLKEIGQQTSSKVLENEDMKLGVRVRCECGVKAKRISKRNAKVLTVFGWVCYWRSYYGCSRCGKKQNRLDKD